MKLGIGGVVTFKNGGIDKFLDSIDLKHIVLETDSPYLSPEPFRGKVNEPKNCLYVTRFLSELRLLTFEQLSTSLYNNSMKVFYKIPIWEQL